MLFERVNEHQVLVARNFWGTAVPKICSEETTLSRSKCESPKSLVSLDSAEALTGAMKSDL